MSDHLFDAAIVDHLLDSFDSDFLNIGVDQKLDSIFDLEDAMKVQTRGNRVTDIGKKLSDYDAIDIGLFVCPVEIFDYFEGAKSRSGRNDCSLADGVRLMADNDKVRAIDIGDGWWQDVDTPSMISVRPFLQSQLAAASKSAAATSRSSMHSNRPKQPTFVWCNEL